MLTYGNPLCGIRRLCWATLLAFLVIAPGVIRSQGNVPPTLPPAAQEALNKGVVAAKVPDYLLAIRYFEEARKLAPQAPVIYLNLGLAESKIPGRELRAMAWFGAYLAANPTAPNAAAVREQITVLQVKNQSNVLRLLKTMEDAASWPEKTPYVSGHRVPPEMTDRNLHWVAKLLADTGDYVAALRVSNGVSSHELFGRISVQAYIADKQRAAGDFQGARRAYIRAGQSARAYQAAGWQGGRHVIITIAYGLARTDDITGALQFADSVEEESWKSQAFLNVGIVQFRAGDVVGAKKTFSLSDQAADRIPSAEERARVKRFIVETKGDLEAAAVARAKGASPDATNPSSPTVVSPSDWINKLDDDDKNSDCPLNTEPFLDLPAYLTSLASRDPSWSFSKMGQTAEKIIKAQNIIAAMLRQQGQR